MYVISYDFTLFITKTYSVINNVPFSYVPLKDFHKFLDFLYILKIK